MREKRRRTVAIILFAVLSTILIFVQGEFDLSPSPTPQQTIEQIPADAVRALSSLDSLEVKGRAPKTGYSRDKFLADWAEIGGCDMRNIILRRDLSGVFVDPTEQCTVQSGQLNDPYTGKVIDFRRGRDTSQSVQIDHVVALSDAWQKGAQQLTESERNLFANDPLNLLAVDGPANQNKSDGDAATWLPPNKDYRCRYVARQIAVKKKYHLWITSAEKDAMSRQLRLCPDQVLPLEMGGV